MIKTSLRAGCRPDAAVGHGQVRTEGVVLGVLDGLVLSMPCAMAWRNEVRRVSTRRQAAEVVGARAALRAGERAEVPQVQGTVQR